MDQSSLSLLSPLSSLLSLSLLYLFHPHPPSPLLPPLTVSLSVSVFLSVSLSFSLSRTTTKTRARAYTHATPPPHSLARTRIHTPPGYIAVDGACVVAETLLLRCAALKRCATCIQVPHTHPPLPPLPHCLERPAACIQAWVGARVRVCACARLRACVSVGARARVKASLANKAQTRHLRLCGMHAMQA
jgi:hypothetical protein